MKRREYKVKIMKASNFLETDHKLFSDIVAKVYNITEHSCNDYPQYFKWYWEKTVPGVLKGEKDIFIANVNNEIAGVIIVKNEVKEKKICTLYVLEEYRKQGIATKLLEEAFKYLGTTKPLVSITEYKLKQFSSIIKKYDWKETQIILNYYNKISREIVFNGKLP